MFKNRGVLYKNSNVVEIIVSIDKIPVPKKLSEDQEVLLAWSFFCCNPPNQQQGK